MAVQICGIVQMEKFFPTLVFPVKITVGQIPDTGPVRCQNEDETAFWTSVILWREILRQGEPFAYGESCLAGFFFYFPGNRLAIPSYVIVNSSFVTENRELIEAFQLPDDFF